MLKRRFLAGMLALTMAVTMLAGCGGGNEPAQKPSLSYSKARLAAAGVT